MMTFYMVRDTKTGLFYKRIHGRSGSPWTDREEASVWTTLAGAKSCFGAITQQNRRMARFGPSAIREPEVVTIHTAPINPKVVFVDGDDWEGLYINGVLAEEGHHVQLEDVMRHLGIRYDALFADQKWLEERGRLPEDLEDVETE